jgi:predicted DCC family thiol-disulfide oxidoreductase YuxK
MAAETGPIVLFDGVCNLCNGAVQFMLRHDRRKRLRFAPLQGQFGQQVLHEHGLDTSTLQTLVFLDNGKVYTHSTAALRAMRALGGGWVVLSWLEVLPRGFRDMVYRWISRNRYRWFGRREKCMVPVPGVLDRFIL